ncbi:MAG: ABC transporter permease [Halobacteriaceae archaeon]
MNGADGRLGTAVAALRRRSASRDGLAVLAAVVSAVVLLPVGWLAVRALAADADAYALLLSETTLRVMVKTVALVAVVTGGSVLVGVPLAVLTVQTDLPFRRFFTVVSALPLAVPSYIGAFAFVSAFGPRGVLLGAFAPLGVESLPTIYGFHGAALVLTLFTYPYVFLTTRASLLSLDPRLVEAARSLNRSRWQAFRRVTLPQILPGITAGALLVALYALADFGTPNIMHLSVFTQFIYTRYQGFMRDYAALLSLQLLVVTALILYLESRVTTSDADEFGGGARGGPVFALGWWKAPAVGFALLVASLCLVVPVGILLMWLFRSGPGYAAGTMSFSWTYGWNSVYVSVLAALVATAFAVPVGLLSATSDSRLSTLADRATYVGYAVPGIVLGIALVTFGLDVAPSLYQDVPLLVFAYVVRFLPQAVGSVRSSALQVDRRLTEAARSLGHSPLQVFRKVTLPLIAPGVSAGAALVFLTTMRELPATLLLSPIGFDTLVTYIWRVKEAAYYGQAAVPALVLIGVSALSLVVILAQEGRNA